MKLQIPRHPSACTTAFLLVSALLSAGCGKTETDPLAVIPRNPEEAATQVEQVFRDAPPPILEAATQASEAMRRGDYEQAVVSLQVAKNQEAVTLQQGMAIHNSMVAMEASLIRAMEAGDPQAKQAYEILRRLKRDR
jgi:hypothetical protein